MKTLTLTALLLALLAAFSEDRPHVLPTVPTLMEFCADSEWMMEERELCFNSLSPVNADGSAQAAIQLPPRL